MSEQELIARIAAERPKIPDGFEARQKNRLHTLTEKRER